MRKKMLLTGGAGFIGSHTVEHFLKNTDWDLIIIDRLTYAGNLNRLTEMGCWETEKSRVRFVYHDFRSPVEGTLLGMLRNQQIDYIVHMGAETHVDRSISDARPFVESNVIGTLNLLEMARHLTPDRFVYVSTDEVYGAVVPPKLHKEGEPHNPSNPYAASKSGAEALCQSFYKTHGVPVIITNTMNNFGERQDPEKFVPMVMSRIICHSPVLLHCKKDQYGVVKEISSRCWLHARNHADALLFLLANGEIGERYNVVGEWSDVEGIADRIAEYLDMSYHAEFIDFHSKRPGHDMHYGLDGTKLAELGWKAPFGLDESLKKTVLWTKEHPEWLGL